MGDDVLPRCGGNIDDRGKGSHNNASDHTHHILLPPEGGRDQLITDC